MLPACLVANNITRGFCFLTRHLMVLREINENGSDKLPVACQVVVAIREVDDASGPTTVSE